MFYTANDFQFTRNIIYHTIIFPMNFYIVNEKFSLQKFNLKIKKKKNRRIRVYGDFLSIKNEMVDRRIYTPIHYNSFLSRLFLY